MHHLSPEHILRRRVATIVVLINLDPQHYSFLLAAPSCCIPSHPVTFPATSSALPHPLAAGSRPSFAAFMSLIACCFCSAPDCFQASLPVAVPTASCYKRLLATPPQRAGNGAGGDSGGEGEKDVPQRPP